MNAKYFVCPQTGLIRDAAAERERDRRKNEAIRLAVKGQRAAEIDRVCGRYELESNEFETADQKAIRIIDKG